MALSFEDLYGTKEAKRRKDAEDVGFIESALAGVATGIINIPKGVISLGAEVFDLVGNTNTAASVEKFFDDLNPFDDEAEARTIGRITQALSQIGIPAFQGAKIGMDMAKKAIDARKAGNYQQLSRLGKIINNVKTSQLAGGIGGAAVGEALVSDEDIGTLGDMLKGTSLEPFAITMMNREDKEGREEAFRKLTNRVKFAVDGSLFNLGIAGGAKGIQALRKPSEKGLLRYDPNDLKETYQKYVQYGLGKAGMLPEQVFETKRLGLDAAEAIKFDAGQKVEKLFESVKKIVPKIENSIFKNEEGVLKEIQNIMQPVPGELPKILKDDITKLPALVEKKSGLVNTARNKLQFEESRGLGETPSGYRKLITEEGPDGFFKPSDYVVTKGGKMDKFLENIRKSVGGQEGLQVADDFELIIKEMRTGVDNMTGKILSKELQSDLSIKLQNEIGNYLTADYRKFNTTTLPFFRTMAANAQKEEALKHLTDAQVKSVATEKGLSPEQVINDKNLFDLAERRAQDQMNKYVTTKSIDEIDPTVVDGIEGNAGKSKNAAETKLEQEVIRVDPSILKEKKLDEFQEIIFGRIKDPKHTYLSSMSKMASLNHTLDLMEDIGKIGAKGTYNSLDDLATSPKFVFGDGTQDGAIRELLGFSPIQQLTKDQKEKALSILNDPKQFKKVDVTKSKDLIGLNPLEGKYIRAPIYDDIFETTAQFLNTSKIGFAYKYGVLAPKAISQITKTILSPITHARNLISAGAFAAANGAIVPMGTDFSALLPKSLGGDIFTTAKTGEGLLETAKRLTYGRIKGTMTAADQDLYKRLLKVGMAKTNPIAGELQRLGMDFYKNAFTDPTAFNKAFRGSIDVTQKIKRIYGKVQDAYVAEDDFWKVITWGLERNRYEDILSKSGITTQNFQKVLKGEQVQGVTEQVRKFMRDGVKRNFDSVDNIYKGTYEEFLDEFAANISRNTVPNYSYVGRAGQALRLSPFGNFIAFPLEIIRTGSNIIEQAIKERASGIPELVSLGNKRLLSFGATVGGIPKITQETFKAMHDVSEEEMNALRRVVPPWSKNSTLLPTGRDKNGYLKYIDFSYSNAYDTLLRPFQTVFNAIAEGKNDESSLKQSLAQGLQEGTVELLKPFTDESIFTEALVDSTIRRGIGRDGRRVWSEADDPFVKIAKGIGHVAKSFEPGSYRQLVRIGDTLLGKTDPKFGQEYELFDELPGLFGFRSIQSNPERSLKFKTTAFGRDLKKAENLFTAPLLRGGRVTPQQVVNTYQNSEMRRFEVLKTMAKDVEAMKKLGMSEFKIRRELRKRKGLSKDIVNDLLLGTYTPKRPSSFFVTRINEINRDLNEKENVNIPNPYLVALPTLNGVINRNRRVNLLEENLKLVDLGGTVTDPRATEIQTPPLGPTPAPDPDVVQTQTPLTSEQTIDRIRAFGGR